MGKVKLAIILVLGTAAIYNLSRTIFDISGSSKRLSDTKSEVSALEGENQSLREELEYKQTPEFIEKEAREKLSMVKPGEKIIIVTDRNTGDEKNSSILGSSSGYSPIYRQWLEVLFR